MAADPQSLDSQGRAALALHRFGFGPRPGDIAAIASDPRAALLADLKPESARVDAGALMDSGAAFRALFEFRQERKAEREAKRMDAAAQPAMRDAEPAPAKAGPPLPQKVYLAEAKARYDAALNAPVGFAQRLVWFWSNHFCVSADKGPVRILCGAYEREAIRPHVLGRFSDMLLAVETHPAMLLYLDNARSIGPDSFAGLRRHKGINENLAREIMELHTLGVRTGYTQDDVINFAKVISGWTVVPPRNPERGGEFVFNERMHEPGAQMVVGKTYAEDGFAQGRAVLEDLARRPATAKHIAFKLARHFVADVPPPSLVDRLEKRFRDTHGDLLEVSRALVTAPEAWAAPAKLKTPSEWIAAALRTTGFAPDIRRIIGAQTLLGEALWRPPAPKGFSDESTAWVDGLAERLDIANQIGRQAGSLAREPNELVDAALGSLASKETREAVKRAASRPQALALLLMAPEFQRR
ncbi:MAG TPA: DUF1800 domain-containing protein [Pseudolabrys sp.]|nr:DUF1800 domain-containing protein [Pseudolabrys sp.]